MGKKIDQARRISHDFSGASDADLDRQIAEFKSRHEAEHGEVLAMDARCPLGPGKVRITFRVRDVPKRK